MTDKEKLSAVRAKIEMRKETLKPYGGQGLVVTRLMRELCDDFLSFIDSMQEEPTIPDIVDEHFDEMLGEETVSEELESWDKFSHIDDAIEDYCSYDSHIVFFTESLNGEPLEEADDREQVESAFKAGVQWQKEQLMKDAVEVEVWDEKSPHITYFPKNLKGGDKVKLIIIKENRL